MREFSVKKGCLGYIVNIGCQICGFSNIQDLKAAICEYLDDPVGTEKKYYNGPVDVAPPQVYEEAARPSRVDESRGLQPASENEQGPLQEGRPNRI